MRTDFHARVRRVIIVATALLVAPLAAPAPAAEHGHDHGGTTPPAKKDKAGETDKAKKPSATVYTCSMHPEITSDKPGKCPKCGMKLVPKEPAEGKK